MLNIIHHYLSWRNIGPAVFTTACALPAANPPEETPEQGRPCILTAPVVTKAPAERTSAQGKEPELLFFDCDQATEPSSTGCGRETGERPTGLRSYSLGGVEGAAFNAQLLRCRVGLVTPCDGRAEVRVYVGNRLLERFRNVPLAEGTVCDMSIQMERLLDELDPLLDRPYNTAILRAELTQECGNPPYAVHVADSFVAGFASGE